MGQQHYDLTTPPTILDLSTLGHLWETFIIFVSPKAKLYLLVMV